MRSPVLPSSRQMYDVPGYAARRRANCSWNMRCAWLLRRRDRHEQNRLMGSRARPFRASAAALYTGGLVGEEGEPGTRSGGRLYNE